LVLTADRLERGVGSVELLIRAMAALDHHLSGLAPGSRIDEQLRNRRARLHLSQEEVAGRAGISRKTLVGVERGQGSIASLLAVLAVIGQGARKAEPVRPSWAHDRSLERDKRFTPGWFLAHVVEAFGQICLDPCGNELSPVQARRRVILPECGLAASWAGTRLAFINPPFSSLVKWLNRAADAWEHGEAKTIVMLVPARTDSSTFQERIAGRADVGLMCGRMRFLSAEGLDHPAPFSLMTVVFGGEPSQVARYGELVPATWLPKTPTPAALADAGMPVVKR
jgi:transcriptional regulator with XRE-family HTH domain